MSENKTSEQYENDDNVLITSKDLHAHDEEEEEEVIKPVIDLWSDPERIAKLQNEMKQLSKLRINTEKYPEDIIIKAVADVLSQVEWSDYNSFSDTIERILTGPKNCVAFGSRTKNQSTGEMDFWILRVFIAINDRFYEFNDKVYSKKDVLMSQQFSSYLRNFCETKLKDETQFWTFTGTHKGKQQLQMSKLTAADTLNLRSVGESNPDNLVMIQFKKKTPEVMIGAKRA